MAKLIDKSALVAEIERELKSINNATNDFAEGRRMELNNLLSFLATLKVKEVEEEPVSNDLEREIKHYVYDPYFDLNGVAVKGATDYLTVEDVADIARHFAQWQKKQGVKEVDLEKELIIWHRLHLKKGGTFEKYDGFYLANNSQLDLAKHFFELGLKAQKGE